MTWDEESRSKMEVGVYHSVRIDTGEGSSQLTVGYLAPSKYCHIVFL
jgi:hypothetical protein